MALDKSIKGLNIKIGADSTGLGKALSEVESQSRGITKELSQVNKLLKFNPKDTELLSQKQRLLGDQIATTKEKLDKLKSSQSQVNAEFKKGNISEEAYRSFQREIVETESKLKHYKQQLKDTEGTHRGFADTLDKVSAKLNSVGDKLQSVGKELTTKVTLPIAGVGIASFKMAADMEDALGATDQIYKGSSDAVKKWASDLESYYGIAGSEALEYANMMGTMLVNIGGLTEEEASKQAQTLIELAGDLTAMYGGTTQDAVRALTGALKGNNTMLDNYGMAVNEAMIKAKALEMGLIEEGDQIDLTTKQAATLALIMEQTGAAQGQAAREADSASGTLRALGTELKNIGEELGDVLLPIFTPLLQKVKELIQKFKELTPEQQENIVKIGLLVAAVGPLITVLGTLSKGTSNIIDLGGKLIGNWHNIQSAGALLTTGLSKGIGFLLSPQGLILVGIAAVIAAGVLLYKNWDTVKEKASQLANWVGNKFDNIKNGITNKINSARDAVGSAIEKIKSFFDFKWELPKLKLPHFNIKGKFSLDPPQVPKLNVDWYKAGGIFGNPSIIGVGEAGPEAVLPIEKLGGILADTLDKMGVTNNYGGDIVVQNMNVRNDNDIKLIAQELYYLQKSKLRGMGAR